MIETLEHMGTLLRVLSESFPMNTIMTGFRCFPKNLCIFELETIVATALEGLNFFFVKYVQLLTFLCYTQGSESKRYT